VAKTVSFPLRCHLFGVNEFADGDKVIVSIDFVSVSLFDFEYNGVQPPPHVIPRVRVLHDLRFLFFFIVVIILVFRLLLFRFFVWSLGIL